MHLANNVEYIDHGKVLYTPTRSHVSQTASRTA